MLPEATPKRDNNFYMISISLPSLHFLFFYSTPISPFVSVSLCVFICYLLHFFFFVLFACFCFPSTLPLSLPGECNDGDVQLVPAPLPEFGPGQNPGKRQSSLRVGNVQVCQDRRWHYLNCDGLWDDNDAAVLCQQLGFYPLGRQGIKIIACFTNNGTCIISMLRTVENLFS